MCPALALVVPRAAELPDPRAYEGQVLDRIDERVPLEERALFPEQPGELRAVVAGAQPAVQNEVLRALDGGDDVDLQEPEAAYRLEDIGRAAVERLRAHRNPPGFFDADRNLHHVLRPLLLFALVLVSALAVASVPLFILYDDDEVTKADAVMVLAGEKQRLPVALEILERRVAPILVISDGFEPGWTQANRLCRFGDPAKIVCVRPDPYSTRGEAQLAGRLARERRWDSLVVVSSRFHLFRARAVFERCFDGELALVASPNPGLRLPLAVTLEWIKLAVTTVDRGC